MKLLCGGSLWGMMICLAQWHQPENPPGTQDHMWVGQPNQVPHTQRTEQALYQ